MVTAIGVVFVRYRGIQNQRGMGILPPFQISKRINARLGQYVADRMRQIPRPLDR